LEALIGDSHDIGEKIAGVTEVLHQKVTDAESVDLLLGEITATPMFGGTSVAEEVQILIVVKRGTLLNLPEDVQSLQEDPNIDLSLHGNLSIDLSLHGNPSIDLSLQGNPSTALSLQGNPSIDLSLQGLPLPNQEAKVVDLERL